MTGDGADRGSGSSGRGRKIFRGLAFAVLVLLLLLALGEVAARLFRREDRSFLVPDARLGYVNEPGFDGRWGVTRRVSVRIDGLGFRVAPAREAGPPATQPRRGIRIACLGDSCTFGFDVEATEAYPELLGGLLRASFPDRPVEVFNAGTIGYSTRHGVRLFRERVAPLHPDVVSVAYNVANRVLWLADTTDLEVPTLWTASPIAALARRSELFNWLYDLGLHRFSTRHGAARGWRTDPRPEDDPLHARKVALLAEFERLRPFVSVDEHEEGLRAIAEAARRAGALVVFVTFGENPRVSGPLEEGEARIEEGRLAEAAERIEAYFDTDKSGLAYTNNLDLLANRLLERARRDDPAGAPPPRFPSVRQSLAGILVRTQRAYAAATERAARAAGVPHLDLRSEMNADPSVFLDFTHFGPRGHEIVAHALHRALVEPLRAALSDSRPR